MTLLEIKTAIATYFELANGVTDLTVNSQDIALVALNQVRRQAELNHDFEFQRKLVTVAVDGIIGGSLDSAVLYNDGVTGVTIKTVVEVGMFDDNGNLRPSEWTTVAEGLVRQRGEDRYYPSMNATYLSDDATTYSPSRFMVTGTDIFLFPKTTVTTAYTLGLEVYVFSSDWSLGTGSGLTISGITNAVDANGNFTVVGGFNGKDLYQREGASRWAIWWHSATTKWYIGLAAHIGDVDSTELFFHATKVSSDATPPATAWTMVSMTGTLVATPYTLTTGGAVSDIWTDKASQYLLWGAIVHLNHLYKHFVYRQEGNLPPPEKLRDEGLEAFKAWDAFRYDQNRTRRR